MRKRRHQTVRLRRSAILPSLKKIKNQVADSVRSTIKYYEVSSRYKIIKPEKIVQIKTFNFYFKSQKFKRKETAGSKTESQHCLAFISGYMECG